MNKRWLVTVTCESPTVCEYTIKSTAPGAKPATRVRSDGIQSVDPTIPNNNLNHTRTVVQANPSLYGGPDGLLLDALRPVLESSANYGRCVGASELTSTWGRLCQFESDAQVLPAAMLLMPTMTPTCGGKAFCAYIAIPLRRKSGS